MKTDHPSPIKKEVIRATILLVVTLKPGGK